MRWHSRETATLANSLDLAISETHQSDQLDTTLGELGLELSEGAELSGTAIEGQ